MSKVTDGIVFNHADWQTMTGSSVVRTNGPFVRPTRAQYEEAARRKLAAAGSPKANPSPVAKGGPLGPPYRQTAKPLKTAAEVLALLDASDAREARRAGKTSPLGNVTAAWRAAGCPATALEARKQYHPPAVVHGWLRAGLLTQ